MQAQHGVRGAQGAMRRGALLPRLRPTAAAFSVSLLLCCCFHISSIGTFAPPLEEAEPAAAVARRRFDMDERGTLRVEETASDDTKNDVSKVKASLKYFDANFFNDSKVDEMIKGAKEFNLPMFEVNRGVVASTDGGLHDPSVLVFSSSWGNKETPIQSTRFSYPHVGEIQRPMKEDDIAFMSVLELGELIRTKQITSQELTDIFIRRLKRYNHVLKAVVTVTEELAHNQSKKADDLLAQGVYLGPLHGIPYGLKDIIAVPRYNTTWGSKTFKDQVINHEAWVYKRLKSAGAILVAKLVTGSLAYDDIWFGGRTRNPWNIEEFSTGSSAGPAAGTLAGMVPFAIGSETAGSMTYPAARCGITCLRPTFGTVGRSGVMSISESLISSVLSAEVQKIVRLL